LQEEAIAIRKASKRYSDDTLEEELYYTEETV